MTQPDVFHNDYLEVVELAHHALSSTQAPYCVIGALALGVWGTPRATYEVDFLILEQCDDPQPFLGLLRTAGFAINETWHEANPMARDVVLRLAHPTAPHFPVDLVLMKLRASRPRDFDDVISIVKHPRLHLDRDYLWSWADRLGLQGELHYVLHAAGTGS